MRPTLFGVFDCPHYKRQSIPKLIKLRLVNKRSCWSKWTIPYSQEAFNAIQCHWKIDDASSCFPWCSVAMLRNPSPGHAEWDGLNTKKHEYRNGLRTDYAVGFRLTTDAVTRCHLTLSRNTHTRQAFAIVQSNDKSYLDELIAVLSVMRDHVFKPQVLAFIFAQQYLYRIEDFHNRLFGDFQAIQRSLRCDSYFVQDGPPEIPDLTDMPQRLTALTNALAVLTKAHETVAQNVAFVEELTDK